MWHGKSDGEKLEWLIFTLFLAPQLSAEGAMHHVEWLTQHSFKNVGEWLGSEGAKWRRACGMRAIPDATVAAWKEFFTEHQGLTEDDIHARLRAAVERDDRAPPAKRRRAKKSAPKASAPVVEPKANSREAILRKMAELQRELDAIDAAT